MVELVGNMHSHTPWSDGEKYHHDIAQAAIAAGLDFVIVTDHNVHVGGLEGMVQNGQGRVLLLVGEEVHDMRREPQANHMLIYGADCELSRHAADPQALIDAAHAAGGICFLAHPHDRAMSLFGGIPALGWYNWEVEGYEGLEIWNTMSSFVNEISRHVGEDAPDTLFNRLRALPLALFPEKYIVGPEEPTLIKWDALLAEGKRVVGVGNSDVHGTPMHLGPIRREIFPYEWCFRAVNTHILTPEKLTGDLARDKRMIYTALARGHSWIGYDLAHPTAGFRFRAEGATAGGMGDTVPLAADTELVVRTPASADIRLIRHGETIAHAPNARELRWRPTQPGAWRVECTRLWNGKKRGWIYSNPIWLESA
jgi:hypothetical protein